MERYYRKWFLPLTLPALALFLLVVLVPFGLGVLYSFSAWRGTYFKGGDNAFEAFVGLKNYIDAFRNSRFLNALGYTFSYAALALIAIGISGLVLALMVNSVRRGRGFFRSSFFLPNLLGGLALGFIWQFIFQVIFTDVLFGPQGLQIEALRYMTQSRGKALFALVIMTTWQFAGYMMIIYGTGLNGIPGELYEAAQIDGASGPRRFFSLTLPMLMPSVTIVLFMTLANSFKLLDQNVALTNGEFDTRLLALQILRTTGDSAPPNYGLAQAQAVIYFVIVAAISLIQVSVTKRREVEL